MNLTRLKSSCQAQNEAFGQNLLLDPSENISRNRSFLHRKVARTYFRCQVLTRFLRFRSFRFFQSFILAWTSECGTARTFLTNVSNFSNSDGWFFMAFPFFRLPCHLVECARVVLALRPHVESELDGFPTISSAILHLLYQLYEALV